MLDNLQAIGTPIPFFFFKPRVREVPERGYEEVAFVFDRNEDYEYQQVLMRMW